MSEYNSFGLVIVLSRHSLDTAIAILLEGSLVNRHPQADRISCHRLVKEAVLHAIDQDRLASRFDNATFSLNARFPKMGGGVALVDQWEQCAAYHLHVTALLSLYRRNKAHLNPPILLCELIRRCAW